MRQLEAAVNHRDGAALSRMAGDVPQHVDRRLHHEIEKLINEFFEGLKQVFPASISTAWRNPADEAAAKRQWIAAFAENGITSKTQLAAGMRQARASGSPFLPSPGQFIAWCKQSSFCAAGLPDEDTLYSLVMTYCARRGGYVTAEDYPWGSNAEYWMVTGLYSMMRANNLSEPELRVKCRSELRKMSQRIEAGEEVPQPRKQLLKLSIPSTTEKAQEGVAMLRATLKRGKS
ncbi:DNA replication protein [Pantoea sp. Al-1710]|uniref:DNA replication protein n=1 Tax=Candidatus Pantoea communis TaxID=2608354 RepID=A0ABX0RII6_9GAMM|nr:replication protein P [Pantoea communis]NIG17465.1 DNA replication protein [Pantoea communis]